MPISSTHPTYKNQIDDWETMRDSLAGDQAIRSKMTRYLPPPPGMDLRGSSDINDILGMSAKGLQSRYSHYGTFAEWPEIVQMTLNAIQGLIHEKPPTVELTTDLEYLIETATPAGDTLQELWESFTRELFSAGRIGLLSEIFDDKVYMCPYMAESITNWHVLPKILGGGATLVVLKEVKSHPKDDDKYEHDDVTRYRELELFVETLEGGALAEPRYRVRVWEAKENEEPHILVTTGVTDPNGWILPLFFGKAFNEIPFTVSNANDRTYKFGPLPLIQAARRAISIFRKTADYFRSLYNKGDPQATIFGIDKEEIPTSIGGSSIWAFENPEGHAEYMDIDGEGIPMQRDAIKDQYERFEMETGRLISGDDGSQAAESGEAVRRKTANHQVSVKSLVINAAAAVQAHLRLIGKQRGLGDDVIEGILFTANLDFAEPMMTGKEFMDYVMAKNAGGPLSLETLHELARRHKITDKTFDDETAEIDKEGPTQKEIDDELERERLAAESDDGNGDDE